MVVDVRGRSKADRDRVGRAIRRRMVEAIGPLVPSRELERARRKLKLRGRRASSPRNLARAGLEIGAEHIIDVYVKRKGRGASVRARIVDVATGETAFEERATVPNRKRNSAEVGTKIGDALIAKLQDITAAYGGTVSAPPPPPPPTAPFAGDPELLPEETIVATPDPAPSPKTSADPYAGIDDPVAATSPSESNGGTKWFSTEAERAPPPAARIAEPEPEKRAWFTPPPPEAPAPTEFVRVGVQGGAGVLRQYTLATDAGASALSYTLDPLSMLVFDFDLVVPRANVGIALDAAFRPVAYSIDRGDLGTAFPSGLLIDFLAAINYHAEVSGSGREAFKVMPNIGVRVTAANVEQHPGNVIPSATLVAAIVGTDARLPVSELVELEGGVFVGLIVAYDETPLASGNTNGGFTAGGKLGMRVWVTPYLGITFDNILTYDTIGFADAPDRPLPPDERGRIQDASVSIVDVRSSVGIAFRF